MSNIAKDLWEIFSVNPYKEAEKIWEQLADPSTRLTEAEHNEIAAEIRWREQMRKIEAQREMQDEADRHDW